MRNYFETMKNGEEFYKNSRHNYVAKTLDGNGFTSRIDTKDRAYNVIARIDKHSEMVIMEIYPGIHCAKETRAQTTEYISKINDKHKTCNLRISVNGNVYIHAEQRFNDAGVSIDMFRHMEAACMKILDTFENVIEKLAHARLLESEEADIERVILNHMKSRRGAAVSELSDMLLGNDDDDDDDSDGADRTDASSLTPFAKWVKERKERAPIEIPADLMSIVGDDTTDGTAPSESSLLDALLSEEDEEVS